MGVMTRDDFPERKPRKSKPKRQPTGDYEVGFCKPPKEGQIGKGEVRNKTGKNGKEKKPADPASIPSVADIGADILTQKVNASRDGKPIEITYLQFLLEQDLRKAVKGDAPIYRTLEGWKRLGVMTRLDERRADAELEARYDPDDLLPDAFLEALAEFEKWEQDHPSDQTDGDDGDEGRDDDADDDGFEDLDDGHL